MWEWTDRARRDDPGETAAGAGDGGTAVCVLRCAVLRAGAPESTDLLLGTLREQAGQPGAEGEARIGVSVAEVRMTRILAPFRRRSAKALAISTNYTLLESWCRREGLPRPVYEHRFYPARRWRFDVAFLAEKVAVEIEGGVWTRGRHTRPKGFLLDCEKYNRAAIEGWCVLRTPPDALLSAMMLDLIREGLTRGRT